MTDTQKNSNIAGSNIEFIPLRENKLPTAFALRTEVTSFWRKIFPAQEGRDSKEPVTDKLRMLSHEKLQNVVPDIEEERFFDALDDLVERISAGDGSHPLLLVTEPFSPLRKTLVRWAEKNGRAVVPAPDVLSDEAISIGDKLLGSPWLIPGLQDWFLRHAFGLDHIRALLKHLHTRDGSRGVIACSSWAWSYLEKVTDLSAFSGSPFVLKSFDAETLAGEIMRYSERMNGQRIEFRNSYNGNPELQFVAEEDETGAMGIAFDDFMKQLVSYARGNFSVASALWAKSLRAEPENDKAVSDRAEAGGNAGAGGAETVWVLPWSRLELATVPIDYDWCGSVILHTLLIHDGLTREILSELLPHTEDELMRCLSDLQERALVARSDGDGQFAVTVEAYPAVRQHLYQSGYMTDPL